MEYVGQLIGGSFDSLILRLKKDSFVQLGEILVFENDDSKFFIQVFDLTYSSQISLSNLEMISGMDLEHDFNADFFDEELQLYSVAFCKNLLFFDKKNKALSVTKSLPPLFSKFRRLSSNDLEIITKPENATFVGFLRSGSNEVDVPVYIDAEKVFRHHVLVAATTGRGKSNLTSVLLWNLVENHKIGFLVLDPHDEYYGRSHFGLKDYPNKENVVYFTNYNVPPGAQSLKINIRTLKPTHFFAVADWSTAQKEAMLAYQAKYKDSWILQIFNDEEPSIISVQLPSLMVLKRRLANLLDVEDGPNGQLIFNGIFNDNNNAGEGAIDRICKLLEQGKTVIVDTSNISSSQEILIGSAIASKLFNKYMHYKKEGTLDNAAQIVILLEEAPRVLGKDVLKSGSNIFSTIAREGRKFKIGLYAITQLPSLIPREILANMNTKIILGIEMKPERQAIIESCPNDLSSDERSIASLNVGEAILSSSFFGFAIPVKVPLFNKENFLQKRDSEKTPLNKKEFELF